LLLPVIAYWNAQSILDWYKLRGYTPSMAVASLASQDTMTDVAKHAFYVNHPVIESDVPKFQAACRQSEKTIVLGCYRPINNGIFVYDVQDPRLSGVEQVTAAHEMLHSAYDRLSAKDKEYIDSLLQDYYDNQLQDQRMKDTIDSYRQTEPDDIVNEMHSIFGTEIASLPQPLEQYYTRYFSNRPSVIAYANSYQAEFSSRSQQIKAADARLETLKAEITAQEDNLEAQQNQIEAGRIRLDNLRSSGQAEQYNAAVASFNSQVENYNRNVAKLKTDINSFNILVSQRNSIAEELASLSKAIDTRLSPQTTK
jgi:DNA repair exonuclease SbcCD ATPase subunit